MVTQRRNMLLLTFMIPRYRIWSIVFKLRKEMIINDNGIKTARCFFFGKESGNFDNRK